VRVLVTGGLGHIGSSLIKNIDGMDVVVNDNMLTQRYCSLFTMPTNVRFVEKDFADIDIEFLSGFDAIVHLAAITDAASSMKNKEFVYETNVTKTQKFIDKAADAGIKLFIFPSSTSVYGKSKDVMYEHEDNVNPQSVYAESKVTIEKYLNESKIKHMIFRFGTIFGISPGMRFHTAINKFCYQASFNQPLTIWKDNFNQSRPYLGIQDAIQAINLALQGILPHNEIYNVVSYNMLLSDIVNIIQRHKNVDINFVDTPLLNQMSYIVSNDKIEKYGFVSSDNLENAITETLNLLKGMDGC